MKSDPGYEIKSGEYSVEADTRQLIVQEQQMKQRQDGVTFDDGIESKGKTALKEHGNFVVSWSKLLK